MKKFCKPTVLIDFLITFLSHVDLPTDPTKCWLWSGGSRHEYGKVHFTSIAGKSRTLAAHRVMYWLAYGHLKPNLFICHSCDNPRCVNPRHLWMGTHKQNMRDRQIKGRSPKGSLHGCSKLDEATVSMIRNYYSNGASSTELARMFHVSSVNIQRIVARKIWTHI